MQINRFNVDTWKMDFRAGTAGAGQLASLKTLRGEISAEAGEMVSITSTAFEGGSGSAAITGNKMEMLRAVNELLSELDPNSPNAAAAAVPVRAIYPAGFNAAW